MTTPTFRVTAALAQVTDPQAIKCHPGLMAINWATLKAAHGQPISQDRLFRLTPQHLIAPAPVASAVASAIPPAPIPPATPGLAAHFAARLSGPTA